MVGPLPGTAETVQSSKSTDAPWDHQKRAPRTSGKQLGRQKDLMKHGGGRIEISYRAVDPSHQPCLSPHGLICLSDEGRTDVQQTGPSPSQSLLGKPNWSFEPPPLYSAFPPESSLREEESWSGPVRPAPCIRNRQQAPRLGSPCGRRAPPA